MKNINLKSNKKFKLLGLMLVFSILFCTPYSSIAATNDTPTVTLTTNTANNVNKYPIVMVHGLFGWGNDELFGINYWGGAESLKQLLTDEGYTVFTPTVGSVSSNWDRACELYAYLKGGTVDYGEAHSKKDGHERYGRTYPGAYPQLGTLSSTNEIQKIHLIGHSMGGQTVRVLAQLLENGDLDEIKATPSESISPLFTGGKHWISSITTIATPHDGSQESHLQYNREPFVHDFFASLAAQGGVTNSDNPCFDFRLDQWGLKKQQDESFESYTHRVLTSSIWGETKDLGDWDLAPEGARDLNSWVKAQNDIYYFSLACSDTHEDLITHHQLPNLNMNPILLKSSKFIGSYTNDKPEDVQIDSSWWENDGVVSVISAISPKVGSKDITVQYNGIPQKGVWNFLGTYDNIDHIEVVGLSQSKDRSFLENQYINLAKMLSKLPK